MDGNLKQMASDLANKSYNDILSDNGDFDKNVKLLRESVKMVIDLDAAEQEPEPEVEDNLAYEKRALENQKLIAEVEEAELKADKLREELAKKDKNDKLELGLKIAGIGGPIVVCILTFVFNLIFFDKKTKAVNDTIKLNTVLQENGCISGINNNKVVSDTFNDLLKSK